MMVLIVAADAAARENLRDIAEEFSDCRCAASAGEALEQAKEPPWPDLLVLDPRLPDRHGWELVEEIRQRGFPPATPIILIVGGEAGEEANGFAQGAAECIRRPVDRAVARARLSIQIERIRNSKTLEQLSPERTACLREAMLAAEASAEAQSMFLDNLTHELRTPLNGIMGMTRLLLDMHPQGKQKEYLELLRRSGESLMALINDLLDFAKLEKRELHLAPIRFGVRDLLNALVTRFSPAAAAKGVRLASMVEVTVPAMVFGDLQRLHQVLSHLVDNGVKFTGSGGQVTIECRQRETTSEGKQLLQFSVIDTGIGISTEKRERIFQAFTQADGGHRRRYSGVGQGLALAARLVSLLGGEVWFESEPGRGTAFHVLLPFSSLTTNQPSH